ncbi:hypothetical protein PL373_06120 [Tenacibaculum maritimum]|nr:hypothetical protein [Tenacibaculum maritimum]MDB0600727.1 hypothetical protein [Tenacibaculum maritimum]MDB0612710.1 hypothetical protein [Tenacibaculum maritimum]
MYTYQNNILSIPAKLLYEELAIIAYETYKTWIKRGKLVKTKAGRGKGNTAWVSYYDIAEEWVKNAVKAKLGDPKKVVSRNDLEPYILPDHKATNFFASHRKPDGKTLKFEKQREKATSVMILNAIETVFKERGALVKKKKVAWLNISDSVNALNTDKWKYKLPSNPRSLERRYKRYLKEGYSSFIHAGEGSDNARKVTANIENLIISLYCLPNKPYSSSVHDMYLQFLGGAFEVFDIKTGEVFDRDSFYVNDAPVEITESTVWNYIKAPHNQLIIKKSRDGVYDFNHKVRPHVNRTAPNYSMSKITLDDRDIMHTRLEDGSKVMAYYAFDDLSGAMIGISHSKIKDHDLYLDCIRNMFQFTASKGLGVPMQMEVEHHLVKDFSEGLMKAGNIFPFVRWCNPTNSQEKYAERLIGIKKYGVEKDNNQNVGRHYLRSDSNRITRQKIFDEQNDNYKTAKASYNKIVENELQEQIDYNNGLHSNQKKYKGMTRLDVFLHHVNPDLPELDKSHLAKYIGEHKEVSIRRNQYVRVQYQKYQLDSPERINLLAPNNYKVDAYYIPFNNEITEVFIYQNNQLICECKPAPTFNRANSEWTDKDREGYREATKYISQFDKMVKEDTKERLQKVSIIKNAPVTIDVTPEIVETEEIPETFELEEVNEQEEINRAINDL